MAQQMKKILLTGNHAAAYAVKLAKVQVVPIYPITPQTPVMEKIAELNALGEMNAELMTVESEHSAMAGCIPASLIGARVFTATSSQGLLLMHEMLHYAAGARVPVVMVNVNRTVASPWGFWPDHLDSLAQRDTGWIQFYCESNQEILDSIIMAYRVAETVSLPAMIIYESFYISHCLEPVQLPEKEQVELFLPPYRPLKRLDVDQPSAFGSVVSKDLWQHNRIQISEAMDKTLEILEETEKGWEEKTGRRYRAVEEYRCEEAEVIIVTMGGPSGTCRDAVDQLRDDGIKVGLVKIRLFRPFPVTAVRKALAKVPAVAVLDRNYCAGVGGILHQEIKAALYNSPTRPQLRGFLMGVGGTNISLNHIKNVVREMLKQETAESVWVR